MKSVKFNVLLLIVVFCVCCLGACSDKDSVKSSDSSVQSTDSKNDTPSQNVNNDTEKVQDTKQPSEDTTEPAGTDDSSNSDASDAVAASGEFKMTSDVKDGWSEKDGIYTITAGGEYVVSGVLEEGRIYIDAEEQEVTVVLDGVSISSSKDSVIYVKNAEEVTIKAHAGTVNVLNDNRPKRVNDTEEAGAACIYSKDDLKIQGKGTLIVNATYNNGIHSKNDIKIKNLTLSVIAPNNAIKGNDSITIEEADVTVTSTQGDGLKTKNTDISSKGKQRGIISILSGTVRITAADDCINAAFDTQIADGAVVTESKY